MIFSRKKLGKFARNDNNCRVVDHGAVYAPGDVSVWIQWDDQLSNYIKRRLFTRVQLCIDQCVLQPGPCRPLVSAARYRVSAENSLGVWWALRSLKALVVWALSSLGV